ncbi:hypothetical protein FHS27_004744 [Rhodopirellula rubra]|uniref:DNA primase/polymerase bifunctional N-terminal domain-containing protein n=1 Tax=Aporhodopirellula rubra TaxID=980271 RepID=A0A7W5E2C0_9BACT|nr:bifunctional DNA primase/polymerase [Aporhodopirellula rubra]MBB3208910.1 hypothetical protein [Aporhodopirellula rubra]
MNTYESALEYADRGWNALPLKPELKMPLESWKRLQEERATKDELKYWFLETRNNIGIVTGKISNLTVVDCDNQEAIEKYYFTTEPSGLAVASPNGHHFYHYHAPGRNSQKDGLDVRNDGGYIVAPPSVNMRGEYYDWDSTEAMTQFDPRWFEEPRKQLKSIMNTGLNYDVAVASCMNYVRQIEHAVSGQGGHNACFRCACKIADFVGSFLSIEDAMPILRDWNEGNKPPFSEQELLHKLRDAYRTKGYGS